MTPLNLIPDPERLKEVFDLASGPAFFLGAVTGLVSILMYRITIVGEAMRVEAAAEPEDRRNLETLRRRLAILHASAQLALASGVCTALLLALAFGSAFFHVPHVYGSGLLFFFAAALVGASIFRFYQEVRLALVQINLYDTRTRRPKTAAGGARPTKPPP